MVFAWLASCMVRLVVWLYGKIDEHHFREHCLSNTADYTSPETPPPLVTPLLPTLDGIPPHQA